jgi:hypothetical protein
MDTTAITTTFTWGATYYDEKGNAAMPERLAADAFVQQFRNRKRYQVCNVDTITVIQRRVIVDRSYAYDQENHGHTHTGTSITTDLRWVVLDTSDDMILCGDRDVQFATQKEANAAMRKWVKNATAEQAEAKTLASLAHVTAPIALISAAEVAALPLPSAASRVSDLVQVRGFGKQRAGYVIEVTDKRVKCILRTVESVKRQAEGDHGYCKWFTKVAQ